MYYAIHLIRLLCGMRSARGAGEKLPSAHAPKKHNQVRHVSCRETPHVCNRAGEGLGTGGSAANQKDSPSREIETFRCMPPPNSEMVTGVARRRARCANGRRGSRQIEGIALLHRQVAGRRPPATEGSTCLSESPDGVAAEHILGKTSRRGTDPMLRGFRASVQVRQRREETAGTCSCSAMCPRG